MSDALDLGCGREKPPGFVGLDVVDGPEVDVVHDLRDTPLPFDDNSFSYCRAVNVLEHLPPDGFVDVLEEVARILEPGSTFLVTGPHYLSHNAPAGDHFRSFSRTSFDVFTGGHEYPTPEPDLFGLRHVEYTWNENASGDAVVRFLRWLKGDVWVRKHVPNAVDEISFYLEVVDDACN